MQARYPASAARQFAGLVMPERSVKITNGSGCLGPCSDGPNCENQVPLEHRIPAPPGSRFYHEAAVSIPHRRRICAPLTYLINVLILLGQSHALT